MAFLQSREVPIFELRQRPVSRRRWVSTQQGQSHGQRSGGDSNHVWELPVLVGCSSGGSGLGTEEMMTRSARIGLAAALLLGGATVAMAQSGPATGGYPPAAKNPNLYGYYGYYPRYAPYYYRTPYYVLGYPVPHYGYMGWRGWR
jgi:hypothetical protein